MTDSRLAKIESEVCDFVRTAYPEMIVRVEPWSQDPSRMALFFIEERFRGLYPRQRYHYLIHLIPEEYYRLNLADAVSFELTPGENPDDIEYPDEQMIADIKPHVLGVLQESGFFAALDKLLFTEDANASRQQCSGDFRHSKQALAACGFAESDFSDVFHVLMDEGGFCDCEVLYNAAPESRLRADYWRRSHAEKK